MFSGFSKPIDSVTVDCTRTQWRSEHRLFFQRDFGDNPIYPFSKPSHVQLAQELAGHEPHVHTSV